MTDLERDTKRLIQITVEPMRKGERRGRRMYRAEYPDKAYAAYGRTRQEALGALLLNTAAASYLDIRIETV